MSEHKSVDAYIRRATQWRDELRQLRNILRATTLEEALRWGSPCYMLDGRHVVGIVGFKSWFGLWFHQGALLGDDRKLLINAQTGRTKALRRDLGGRSVAGRTSPNHCCLVRLGAFLSRIFPTLGTFLSRLV